MMRHSRLAALYLRHFREHRRERMFLASASFFLTFVITRVLTHWGRERESPFRVLLGGTHVHHLVWGILLLLAVGYTWLIQVDAGPNGQRLRIGRLTAVLFGIGAALTLDEFALWLNLEDVYWEREGRASIDAVMLFGGLVSVGLWGGPFFRALTRHAARLFRIGPAGARAAAKLDQAAAKLDLAAAKLDAAAASLTPPPKPSAAGGTTGPEGT
jgi:hypothetical protein